MSAVSMTNVSSNFGKALIKALITVWIGFLAFGESAGRARAAAELHRQGYVEEARRLMLDAK